MAVAVRCVQGVCGVDSERAWPGLADRVCCAGDTVHVVASRAASSSRGVRGSDRLCRDSARVGRVMRRVFLWCVLWGVLWSSAVFGSSVAPLPSYTTPGYGTPGGPWASPGDACAAFLQYQLAPYIAAGWCANGSVVSYTSTSCTTSSGVSQPPGPCPPGEQTINLGGALTGCPIYYSYNSGTGLCDSAPVTDFATLAAQVNFLPMVFAILFVASMALAVVVVVVQLRVLAWFASGQRRRRPGGGAF